jgi:hypothetical protein
LVAHLLHNGGRRLGLRLRQVRRQLADWEGVSCGWQVAHHVLAIIRVNRHGRTFLPARQAS